MEDEKKDLPEAQSMKSMDKKHLILVGIGVACWLLGLVFGELRVNALTDIFYIAGIICACIGIYKNLKYRKFANSQKPFKKNQKQK